jgi:hypothetical protein
LRASIDPRSLPGVTIRWFTDADRQDMRVAAEEARVLAELVRKYAPCREMTPEDRAEAIAYFRKHGDGIRGLPIDPYRRS